MLDISLVQNVRSNDVNPQNGAIIKKALLCNWLDEREGEWGIAAALISLMS